MATKAALKIKRMLGELESGGLGELDRAELGPLDQGEVDFADNESVLSHPSDISGLYSIPDVTTGRERNLKQKVHELEHALERAMRQRTEMEVDKDRVIANLQQQLEEGLRDLQQRQRDMEAAAPHHQEQLSAAKAQLMQLDATVESGKAAMQIPEERRSIAEAVQAALYKGVQRYKQETDALRAQVDELQRHGDLSGELADRQTQEAAAARREQTRVTADAASRVQRAEAEAEHLRQRISRLDAELQEAMVRSEVLTAKGRMYDELQATAQRLERENAELRGAHEAMKRLEVEVQEKRADLKDRDNSMQMLMMDKAYLTKEVDRLKDVQASMERKSEELEKSNTELKLAREKLYEKLLANDSEVRGAEERRLESELARIQATAKADLERIRRESSEQYERELRLLRELRDEAVSEATRAKGNLKDLQTSHDELVMAHSELSKRTDAKSMELTAELKMKTYECSRLQLMADERDAALKQVQMQADMLQEKVRVLTDNYYDLDTTNSRRIAELEAELTKREDELSEYRTLEDNLDLAVENWGDTNTAEGRFITALDANTVPTQVKRRVKQSMALAARCSRLEAERLQLAKDKEEAGRMVRELEAQLAVAKCKKDRANQPQSYILGELDRAESQAERATQAMEGLKSKLQARESELRKLLKEKQELKADLKRILSERTTLDSTRKLLASAFNVNESSFTSSGRGGPKTGPPIVFTP